MNRYGIIDINVFGHIIIILRDGYSELFFTYYKELSQDNTKFVFVEVTEYKV